jgi:hypothetical protein
MVKLPLRMEDAALGFQFAGAVHCKAAPATLATAIPGIFPPSGIPADSGAADCGDEGASISLGMR